MVIIYGRRAYGRVDAHGGEYAHTTFAHLWYMPLFPIQSYWITRDGEAPLGFEIGLHGRSMLTAYLRMWTPLVAAICFATGSPIIGAAFAALGVAAWLWRRAPASRRSDFNLVAYGTRCEPSLMPRDMRDQVKRTLDARWEELALGKPPEDIAQFGAKTIDEASTAYGLLRLSAVDRRDASAHAAADRIAAGQYDKAPAGEGPYREDVQDSPPSALLAQVEALAAAHGAAAVVSMRPWYAFTRGKGLLLGVLATVGLGGILAEGQSLRGATPLDNAELQQGGRDEHDFFRVECDRLDLLGSFSNDHNGYGCQVTGRMLAVVTDATHDETGTVVLTGTLSAIDAPNARETWPDDIRRSSDVFHVYLTEKSILGHQVAAIVCILGELLLAGVIGFWLVLRARRRA